MKIIGSGTYIGGKKVSNNDLSETLDTTDEWIYSRTGIKNRFFSNINIDEMATIAARNAIKDAGIDKNSISYIIVTTITADSTMPSIACKVQKSLQIINQCMSLDLIAACTGFIYGMDVLVSLLEKHNKKIGLVISVEKMSDVLNFKDRNTAVLFGDGAAAVVVENIGNNVGEIFNFAEGDDNNSLNLATSGDSFVTMKGRDIYKFAIKTIKNNVLQALEAENISLEEIDYFLLHQANSRMNNLALSSLGVPIEKIISNLETIANTSSASIPLLIQHMKENGLWTSGKKILFIGFGGGLTWGRFIYTI